MTKIIVKRGDITKISADVIVNAANSTLLGGGGVDGAIHYAAGHELFEECRLLGRCESGEAKMTKGYKLPARHVIHTVGPIYGREGSKEAELLRKCYTNSLLLAQAHHLRTIALPAISTGVFGYPKEEAAKIALSAVKEFIDQNPDALDEVYFVLFNEANFNIYKDFLWL